MEASFLTHMQSFVERIEALRSSLPLSGAILSAALETGQKEFHSYLKESCEVVEDTAALTRARIPEREFERYFRRKKALERLKLSDKIQTQSFIVTLVSQFDLLVADLIRLAYDAQPALLNSSGKALTFAEISQYETLEEVKSQLIAHEVDAILRDSHLDQLAYFEKKLGITLRSDPGIIARFVEVSERRNLFVHADGKVSKQYLKNCKDAGYEWDKEPAMGDSISSTPQYFFAACDILLEVGIKLSHIVWNKLIPSEREAIETSINEAAYYLIQRRRYTLAVNFLDFGLELPKGKTNNASRMTMQVNKAQCHKWLNKVEECKRIVAEIDWSAASSHFLIAKAALEDRFEDAAKLMREVGPHGKIGKLDYQEWPLFKKFRESEAFQKVYVELFGEKYESIPKEAKQMVLDVFLEMGEMTIFEGNVGLPES